MHLKVPVAMAALAVALGVTGPAAASTATIENPRDFNETLVIQGGAGEANALTLSSDSSGVMIVDAAGISPGANCSRPVAGDTRRVFCPSTGALLLRADLGDGDDVITTELPAAIGLAELNGGPGNDILRGGAGGDMISGDAGDDRLLGFASDDVFPSDASDGADSIEGGAGIGDRVSYANRSAAMTVTLDGAANDGARGERDDVDTEDVYTGSGDDRIVSFAQPSTLKAGEGDDVVRGGANTDELFGGPGRDRLDGGSGSDRVEGEQGRDRVGGGRGDDLLRGGSGNDLMLARDGRIDRVGCGRGRDTVVLDRLDMAFAPCERVRRRGAPLIAPVGIEALPLGFALFASPLISDGRFSPVSGEEGRAAQLPLGCPRDMTRTCSGRATLRVGRRSIAVGSFRVRPAGRATLEFRVPRDVARRVARRGRVRGKLVIRTVDSRGRALTLTTPFSLFDEVPTL